MPTVKRIHPRKEEIYTAILSSYYTNIEFDTRFLNQCRYRQVEEPVTILLVPSRSTPDWNSNSTATNHVRQYDKDSDNESPTHVSLVVFLFRTRYRGLDWIWVWINTTEFGTDHFCFDGSARVTGLLYPTTKDDTSWLTSLLGYEYWRYISF